MTVRLVRSTEDIMRGVTMDLSRRRRAFLGVGLLVVAGFVAAAPTGVSLARAGGPFSPGSDRAAGTAVEPVGDTLTVIQRPLPNIPAFVLPGGSFTISCEASAGTTGWTAELMRRARHVPLTVTEAVYEPSTLWWRITATAPTEALSELYDLTVTVAGGISDVTKHAVKILPAYRADYYFVHITDTHLPTPLYYYVPGADADSSAIVDLREVVNDVNIINPAFVLLTGDLINEAELEDYRGHRCFSKAERVLGEFQVPVFLTSGNHDLGGWDETPPPDGTARRDWWRFFGWKRLANPPSGAPARTQDYSFDYGPVHYVGLEAYLNYDNWRSQYYGSQSFVPAQLEWLGADLAAAAGSTSRVLFYHDDFGGQLNLRNLGVQMALWGHIHHDSGSLTVTPYNLATGTTVGGARTYRVVRVSNGVLTPLASVSAGASGERLRVAFSPANDGTHASMVAVVTNDLPIRFQDARLRVLMPKLAGDIQVSGGTLEQIDDSGPVLICYVGVDLLPNATQTVEVTGTGENPAPALRLAQSLPNPFHATAVIGFDLPSAGPVRLTVFAPDGGKVATLVDKVLAAGPGAAVWEGRDDQGRPVPSGRYFYRLVTPAGARARGLSLVR
jgi:3',5'-cyclic AMP phosphodiesterase CpdA